MWDISATGVVTDKRGDRFQETGDPEGGGIQRKQGGGYIRVKLPKGERKMWEKNRRCKEKGGGHNNHKKK